MNLDEPIQCDTDRHLRLLAAIDPALEGDGVRQHSLDGRVRTAVFSVVDRDVESPLTRRRVSTGSWILRGGAVAAAAAVAVATVTVLGQRSASAAPALAVPLPFGRGSHTAARAFLLQEAALLDRTPASAAGSGLVRFTEIQDYSPQVTRSHGKTSTAVDTTVRQIWYAPDGSTQVKEFNQAQDLLGGDVGAPKPVTGIDHTGWANWPDVNKGFPTAPTQVTARLISGTGGVDAGNRLEVLKEQAAQQLQTGTATPAQTAGIYRVLAGVGDVFDAGVVTDRIGRKGHAIGLRSHAVEAGNFDATYLIIDPGTGMVLQTENAATRPPSGLKLPAKPWVQGYDVIRQARQVAAKGAK